MSARPLGEKAQAASVKLIDVLNEADLPLDDGISIISQILGQMVDACPEVPRDAVMGFIFSNMMAGAQMQALNKVEPKGNA